MLIVQAMTPIHVNAGSSVFVYGSGFDSQCWVRIGSQYMPVLDYDDDCLEFSAPFEIARYTVTIGRGAVVAGEVRRDVDAAVGHDGLCMGEACSHTVDVLFVCHFNSNGGNLDGRLIDIPDVVAAGAADCAAVDIDRSVVYYIDCAADRGAVNID